MWEEQRTGRTSDAPVKLRIRVRPGVATPCVPVIPLKLHPRPPGAVLAVERRAPVVLVAMMAVTAAAWYWRGRGIPAPWIYGDEFIYWELGRNLAERGDLLIREQRLYYSLVTPLTALPGHLLGDEQFAYQWIKAINSILMATAAIPAYGLARMGLRPLWALLFAGATLALPGFAYSGSVMTEAAFLPVFLAAVWALARALERPTLLRQAVAGAAVVLAVGVRLQAIALFAAMALVVAFVVVRGRQGSIADRLRRGAPMLAFSIGVPLVGLGWQRARGGADKDLLGGYNTANTDLVRRADLWEWGLRHVAVTALAVALIPVAFAIGAWAPLLWRRFRGGPGDSALLACLAPVVPMLVIVTVFAANNAERVQERNLFYIEPLLLLAAMIGLARGYSRPAAIVAGALIAWLMLRLPLDELLAAPPLTNTFSLYAIWDIAPDLHASPAALVAGIAIAGAALTIVASRAPAPVTLATLPLLAAAFMITVSVQVSPVINAYAARASDATVPAERDWIERADTDGEPVGLLWSSDQLGDVAWQAEIFNPKVESVYGIPNPLPGLPSQAQIDPATGHLVAVGATSEPPPERFLVAPVQLGLVGRPVARADVAGGRLAIYDAARPLRVGHLDTGYYPDGWTTGEMVSTRYGCDGGTWTARLRQGLDRDQVVSAVASGGRRADLRLTGGRSRTLRLRATPDLAANCTLTLATADVTTEDELNGSGDLRVIGLRAQAPSFAPATTSRAGQAVG